MKDPVEYYRDFIIYKATYYDDFGAWLDFCPFAFHHKDMDDDPERLYRTYGWAKTIEKCKEEIDDRLYEEDLLLIPQNIQHAY